jgi:hypothetical protein
VYSLPQPGTDSPLYGPTEDGSENSTLGSANPGDSRHIEEDSADAGDSGKSKVDQGATPRALQSEEEVGRKGGRWGGGQVGGTKSPCSSSGIVS